MLIRQGKVVRKWQLYDLTYDLELVDWPAEDAIVQVRKYLSRAVFGCVH